MKKLLAHLSLTRKVQIIILVAATIALLSSSLVLLAGQGYKARDDLQNQLATLADVVGKNSAGALSFDDANQAKAVLMTLEAQPSIEAAVIYTAFGEELARMAPNGMLLPVEWITAEQQDGLPHHRVIGLDHIELLQPVMFDSERIGTIYVRSSLQPVIDQVLWAVAMTAAALLFGALIALGLAAWLTPAIVDPIGTLAKLAKSVTTNEDFSLRAEVEGRDEISARGQGPAAGRAS